jgi:hypothetical protein
VSLYAEPDAAQDQQPSIICGGAPPISIYAPFVSGAAVAPSNYSQSYSFTPSAPITYVICGYISQPSVSTATDAVASVLVTAAPAPATVAIAVPANAPGFAPETATITGTASVSEDLDVEVCGTIDGCSTLTSRTAVGPGSFSRTVSFTPTEFDTYTFSATVLDDRNLASVDATAEALSPSATMSATSTLGAPSLTAPQNQASGPELNPLFSWQGGPGETYGVVIGRVTHAGEDDFVQLQQNGYLDLSSGAAGGWDPLASSNPLKPLAHVATFTTDASGSGSVQLARPLSPGTYAWQVVAAGPSDLSGTIVSESRTFTVLGPKLTTLRARTAWHRGGTYAYPGYATLSITATPYATIKIAVTTRGHTKTITEQSGSRSNSSQRINWSCKSTTGAHSRYVVTATDQEGDSRTVRGRLPEPTVARCRALHQKALAAQRRKSLAWKRLQQQEQAALHAANERFIANCKAEGGAPITLTTGSGAWLACRAPYGGLLWVIY